MQSPAAPLFFAALFAVAIAAGPIACNPSVTTEEPAPQGLPRPDIVIVHDFVEGLLADSLARHLVARLKENGIVAYRAAGAPEETIRTITIEGRFLTVREEGVPVLKAEFRFSQGTPARRRQLQVAQSAFSEGFDPARSDPDTIDDETAEMADDIAGRMETYYRRQGWLH